MGIFFSGEIKLQDGHGYVQGVEMNSTLALDSIYPRVKLKFQNKNFFKPTSTKKAILKTFEHVPKSPWITTERNGANTFPFYNLPPVLKNILEKGFSVLFPFLDWIK